MRRLAPLLLLSTFVACSQTGGCAGCLQSLPNGYQGPRFDAAASARLTASGFTTVNTTIGPQLLQQFAPGNQLVVPIPCSIQNVAIGAFPIADLTIADEGALYCTSEACGQLDGKCDVQDVPKIITLNINTFKLTPRAPDQVSASLDLTVATGKIMISSVDRNSPLCLFGEPVKCSVDLDTARAAPTDLQLDLHIEFTADTRWDRVLTFSVPDIGGSTPCGSAGAMSPPACLDPNDVSINKEGTGSCGVCSLSNFSVIKSVILSQITASLKTQIEDALRNADCRPCDPSGICPTSSTASTSSCQVPDGGDFDAGICIDPATGHCVPALLGIEGRVPLAALGAFPAGSALDLSLVAGGSAEATAAGFTQGVIGGFQEVTVASCVKTQTPPQIVNIPLAPLDGDGPALYDVGIAFSQQALTQALFHAQQSGALCLELGHETVSQLDSSLLATVMPSMALLSHGDSVPLRVAIRPSVAPTATIGQNVIDPMTGMVQEPLVTLVWPGVGVDVYAKLEERYARVFTVNADVAVPLALSLTGCSDVTPVIGDVSMAITNVHGTNSEMLAEPLTVIEALVPSLLSLAEPALAQGLPTFTVPQVNGWQVRLLEARGVGQISGTNDFAHVGLYADLVTDGGCPPPTGPRSFARAHERQRDTVSLEVSSESPLAQYSYRVAGGFWSQWRAAKDGALEVKHPRLLLGGEVKLEVRSRDLREPRNVGAPEMILLP